MYYKEIGLTEGADVIKRKNSKECMVCHYWYLKHGLKLAKIC